MSELGEPHDIGFQTNNQYDITSQPINRQDIGFQTNNQREIGPRPIKLRPGKAQISSYVFAAMALALLIVSGFLLGFLRDTSTVYTYISISSTATPSPPPLKNEISLQAIFPGTIFTYSDFNKIVTPLVSIGPDIYPTTTTTITTPVYPPDDLPFDMTNHYPLQIPPQGYGFISITPDASKFMSSFDNGYAIFAQYYSVNAEGSTNFEVYPDAYKSPQNFIYYNCAGNDPSGSTNKPTINDNASAVGAVGYSSMAVSADGLRLYVAYHTPKMGTNDSAQVFPLLQVVGRVAVYTLANVNSNDWNYTCSLGLNNPFGSQTAGLSLLCDANRGEAALITGDNFGSIIRTSTNLINSRRVTACRASLGSIQENGASIAMYEENDQETQDLTGVLQLGQVTSGTYNTAAKMTFGNDFNVSNDVVLAAVRLPTTDCSGTVVGPLNDVVFFRRNAVSQVWEFAQIIPSPDITEDFGTSIQISPDADMAIIGSPTKPTDSSSGIGGHIYVYSRSNDGNSFALNQIVVDPFASVNLDGAFGYFLSVDPLFLVLSISANQRNQLNLAATIKISATANQNKPKVIFAAINQKTRQVDVSRAQKIEQPSNDPNDVLDPLLGCNLAMAFENNEVGNLQMCLNSPLNRLVRVDSMRVG